MVRPVIGGRAEYRRLLAITLAALLLFGYGLGAGTLWDQDEPKYAGVSREILETGDPITLHSNGRPWFVHPPLFFWLQAMTGWAFGFTEATVRIWSAISGAGAVGVTFLLARLFYGPATGVLAAAILATTFQFLVQSRLGVFDPTLVLFMLLALYMYLVAYTGGSGRAAVWAWVWAGLATLTKGPIGLLLPAMAVVGLWLVRRDWSAWRRTPLLGPAFFCLIGLSWYLIEALRHGEPFLRSAVGYYLFSRFFGVVENQPGPWWYYVPVLIVGAFPWTAFLPAAVAYHARRRRELGSQVILLWCGITLLFYSLAGTKLPNYILPVYPLLAIGIARLWEEQTAGLMRMATGLLAATAAAFVAAIALYGWIKFPAEMLDLRVPLAAAAAVFAAGPLLAAGLLLIRRPPPALAALLLTPVVAVPVLVHLTLPAMERYRPLPRIARAIAQEARPSDAVAAVAMNTSASLGFYSGRHIIWVESPDDLVGAICRHRRLFVVVPPHQPSWWTPTSLPAGARLQGEDRGYRIFLKEGPGPCSGGEGAK
ncbi:MAG: glycosyltransferase family 39 protein [bacterium]|nr:glycosyltransferase family 39 protein [bacterium]